MSIRSFIPRNNVFNNVVPYLKSKYNHIVSPESQEDGAKKSIPIPDHTGATRHGVSIAFGYGLINFLIS